MLEIGTFGEPSSVFHAPVPNLSWPHMFACCTGLLYRMAMFAQSRSILGSGIAQPPCPCSDRCYLAHCYATSQMPTYILVSLSGEYREGVPGGTPLPGKVC